MSKTYLLRPYNYAMARLPLSLFIRRMLHWSAAFFCLLPLFATGQPVPVITDYHVSFGQQAYAGQLRVVLRRFGLNGQPYCLTVNPQTLDTYVQPDATPKQPAELLKTLPRTAYTQALHKAEAEAKPLQDAGITHTLPDEKGIVLTIDLCPSHKPLDRVIFTSLMRQLKKLEKPIPLALSVTGVWMREHPDDLAWVKEQQQQGLLKITWINHSFNHRVSPDLPLNENFLLEPGTNLTDEVLKNEVAMLENGLTPSVFFRFPGLISSQSLVDRITAFGLIPVGSDAWLAKGQQPGRGSIVLIHGNGNEPIGVRDFIGLLKKKQADIEHRDWLLYDLRESVSRSEQ